MLRRLRGDAAEIVSRLEGEGDLLVELRVALDATCVLDHDVLLGVEAGAVVFVALLLFVFAAHERVVDDDLGLAELHVAGLGVKRCADNLSALAVFAAVGGGERRSERFNHAFAADAALGLQLVERAV